MVAIHSRSGDITQHQALHGKLVSLRSSNPKTGAMFKHGAAAGRAPLAIIEPSRPVAEPRVAAPEPGDPIDTGHYIERATGLRWAWLERVTGACRAPYEDTGEEAA